MKLKDLRKSISELPPEEARKLVRDQREVRRDDYTRKKSKSKSSSSSSSSKPKKKEKSLAEKLEGLSDAKKRLAKKMLDS